MLVIVVWMGMQNYNGDLRADFHTILLLAFSQLTCTMHTHYYGLTH